MHGSLRSYLQFLEERGKLLRVRRKIEQKFELNAVVRKIQQERNLPIIFENVSGTPYRVVSNTLGNYAIVAEILGVGIQDLARTWAERMVRDVRSMPEQQEAAADLEPISFSQLPHITFSELDAGPYLTAGVIVARDPETEIVNLSYHRMQMIGPTELRCRLSTSGDLFRIQQIMEKRGEPLKVAVLIGLPPHVMLAAATTESPTVSEYDIAARLSGRRVPMRPAPVTGLPIPATTEFVIEGEILPRERRREGPFGEWMDYYVPPTDNHVIKVESVHARPEGIFYAISAGSAEELVMSSVPIAGLVFKSIRTWVPSVRDVTCFPHPQFCVVKVGDTSEGQARKAILAALGAEMNRMLYCIAVDEDVNIHDLRDVTWAMATRCRPDRDIFQIPEVPSFARDPHRAHWGRMGIDATKPREHAAAFERKKTPGLDDLDLSAYLD